MRVVSLFQSLMHGESGNRRILLRTMRYIFFCLVLPTALCVILLQANNGANLRDSFAEKRELTLAQSLDTLRMADYQVCSAANAVASDRSLLSLGASETWNVDVFEIRKLHNARTFLRTLCSSHSYIQQVVCVFDTPLIVTSNGTAISPLSGSDVSMIGNDFIRLILSLQDSSDAPRWRWSAQNRTLMYEYPMPFDPNDLIYLSLNLSTLADNLAANLDPGQEIVLTTPDGAVILSTCAVSEALLPRLLSPKANGSLFSLGADRWTLSQSAFDIFGCNVTVLQSANEYLASLRGIAASTLLVTLFICLIGLWVSLLIAHQICKPYDVIVELLREPLQDSEASYQNLYAQSDDLGIVRSLIHSVKYQVYAAQSELESRNKLLRDAQASALQAQINPHFLYNTLDAINWAVMKELSPDNHISDALCDLSRLFSVSTDVHNPIVPLREEIEHIRLYIRIQEFRFKHAFHILYDIPESLMDKQVVNLTLQPLVENAFHYGLRPEINYDAFRVCIRAWAEEDRLYLSVLDNGVGFSPEALESVRASLQNPLVVSDHVGIANIHKRLVLTFGEAYGLTISSKPAEGTSVTMVMPLQDILDAKRRMYGP